MDRLKDFTPKEALYSLFFISEQLVPLMKSRPEYSSLIKYITQKKEGYSPPMKSVILDTGLKRHELEKQLKELYLLVLDDKGFLKFNKPEYHFHYRDARKHYYCLELQELLVVPSVGDIIESFFLSAGMDLTVYYVKRISHDFSKDKHVVDFHLATYPPDKPDNEN